MLNFAYGYNMAPHGDDAFYKLTQKAVSQFGQIFSDMNWAVNHIPARRCHVSLTLTMLKLTKECNIFLLGFRVPSSQGKQQSSSGAPGSLQSCHLSLSNTRWPKRTSSRLCFPGCCKKMLLSPVLSKKQQCSGPPSKSISGVPKQYVLRFHGDTMQIINVV